MRLDTDEAHAYLDTFMLISVHINDGRVVHTPLNKLDEVLAARKLELTRRKRGYGNS